jgi:2-beta-glucuronyltransferase
MSLAPIADYLATADLVVFESGDVLLLFERVRRLAPQARLVYRVSDVLELVRAHPIVLEAERRTAPRFDLVSVPTPSMAGRFPSGTLVRHDAHGIEKRAFDKNVATPFVRPLNAVFSGVARLDRSALEAAALALPEWTFHVLGYRIRSMKASNIRFYGRLDFEQTVPYLKHADVGLQLLEQSPGAECFAGSLKMIQYAYCRLPIVAPAFMRTSRPNVHYYDPLDHSSVAAAVRAAAAAGRCDGCAHRSSSWEDVALGLAG